MKHTRDRRARQRIFALLALLALLASVACGKDDTTKVDPNDFGELQQSTKNRVTDPNVAPADLDALTDGNNLFAWKLYRELKKGGTNLFYSPYSISTALAMTFAGAKGTTKSEMAATLGFTLGDEKLHPAFNALDLALQKRGEGAQGVDGKKFQLNVVNALWGRKGYSFLDTFLDELALNYGAGMRIVDFLADPEGSRLKINNWVANNTGDRIQDLIPSGLITPDTILVLTNAIYFNAAWALPFEKGKTRDATFTKLDESTTSVKMMSGVTGYMRYFDAGDYEALALPYDGDELSMLLILPKAGGFTDLEATLDANEIDALIQQMTVRNVEVHLPQFELTAEFKLKDALQALGMTAAFSDGADFSGMNGTGGLKIDAVVHKAFVKVTEEGTEAAAATGVIIGPTSVPPPPVVITFDRPFIFLIRDHATNATLFVGRLLEP